MIATFLTVTADKFSLNGVEVFKIFIPILSGNNVKVVNAFDGQVVLLPNTNFADVQVNGTTFASALLLVNALNSVIYSRATVEGVGAYIGVSSIQGNALTNGPDGGPYFDERLLEQTAANKHGIISYNSGFVSGFGFNMSMKYDFFGTRFEAINQPITLDAPPTTTDWSRFDVVVGNSAGTIEIIKGTAALSPEKPVVDPDTQLEATFFQVKNGQSAPEGVTGTTIYGETGTAPEFEAAASGASVAINSAAASQSGNYSIEMTAVVTGDNVSFVKTVPVDDVKEISFYIKNKAEAIELNPLDLLITGNKTAGAMTIYQGNLNDAGYDRLNITDWQFISIPVNAGELIEITSIQIRANNDNGNGFFIDTVNYISGTQSAADVFQNEVLIALSQIRTDFAAADILKANVSDVVTKEEFTRISFGDTPDIYNVYYIPGVNDDYSNLELELEGSSYNIIRTATNGFRFVVDATDTSFDLEAVSLIARAITGFPDNMPKVGYVQMQDIVFETQVGAYKIYSGGTNWDASINTAAKWDEFVITLKRWKLPIFELALGNPDTDGKLLESTIAGVRTWTNPTLKKIYKDINAATYTLTTGDATEYLFFRSTDCVVTIPSGFFNDGEEIDGVCFSASQISFVNDAGFPQIVTQDNKSVVLLTGGKFKIKFRNDLDAAIITGDLVSTISPLTDTISFAMSNTTGDLVAGDVDSFHAPYNFNFSTFWPGVNTAPTGSALVVDVKINGVSITSSKAIIDAGEFTSLTGTAPVLITTTVLKGDLITPVISQTGSIETGKSLKLYLEIIKN